jgi:hypothetical protein
MNLINLGTGEIIRQATVLEAAESMQAAMHDGGHGAIVVDGVTCFVDTDVTDEELRAIYGDCQSCVALGASEPGIASERASWRDADGRVSEDVYHVCPACLRVGMGGPGYVKA